LVERDLDSKMLEREGREKMKSVFAAVEVR
jgi:hypothetical protein